MSHSTLSLTLSEPCAPRLDKALSDAVPEAAALSRSRLRVLIEAGAVSVDQAIVTDPRFRAMAGQHVQISVPVAEDVDLQPENIPLDVVYEDDDLIVVNKPVGMVVHPAPGAWTGTLVSALLHHCGESLSGIGGERRPGIVHRIDKDTSGLLVVAKTDAAHHGLAAQFAAHDLDREYLALCWGTPDAGDPRLAGLPAVQFEPGGRVVVRSQIARHPQDRKRMAVLPHGGRHAVTRTWVEDSFAPVASLMRCRLETGRTHQIRVHMAHIGHGLIGDPVYGRNRAIKGTPPEIAEHLMAFPRQALHATTLGFTHPINGKSLQFGTELPKDFDELLGKLRKSSRERVF